MAGIKTCRWLHWVAIIALIARALAPTALLAFAPERLDADSFICAGHTSANVEVDPTVALFIELATQTDEDAPLDPVDCDHCVFGAGAVLSNEDARFAPFRLETRFRDSTAQNLTYRFAALPPLGGRAPPQTDI